VTGIVIGDPVAPGAVTVTCAVYVPAAKPAIAGVTVTVSPDVDTLSHAPFSDALHDIVPPPKLDTESALAAGSAPPAIPPNARLAGDTDNTGGGGSTVNVTATVLDEPAPTTVTSVVYVPADNPAIDGVTITVPAFVPPAGDTDNQPTDSDTDHTIDPPPAFDTDTDFAAGATPPSTPTNDKLTGDTDNTAGAGGADGPAGVLMSVCIWGWLRAWS
jgi:hypothetical protein